MWQRAASSSAFVLLLTITTIHTVQGAMAGINSTCGNESSSSLYNIPVECEGNNRVMDCNDTFTSCLQSSLDYANGACNLSIQHSCTRPFIQCLNVAAMQPFDTPSDCDAVRDLKLAIINALATPAQEFTATSLFDSCSSTVCNAARFAHCENQTSTMNGIATAVCGNYSSLLELLRQQSNGTRTASQSISVPTTNITELHVLLTVARAELWANYSRAVGVLRVSFPIPHGCPAWIANLTDINSTEAHAVLLHLLVNSSRAEIVSMGASRLGVNVSSIVAKIDVVESDSNEGDGDDTTNITALRSLVRDLNGTLDDMRAMISMLEVQKDFSLCFADGQTTTSTSELTSSSSSTASSTMTNATDSTSTALWTTLLTEDPDGTTDTSSALPTPTATKFVPLVFTVVMVDTTEEPFLLSNFLDSLAEMLHTDASTIQIAVIHSTAKGTGNITLEIRFTGSDPGALQAAAGALTSSELRSLGILHMSAANAADNGSEISSLESEWFDENKNSLLIGLAVCVGGSVIGFFALHSARDRKRRREEDMGEEMSGPLLGDVPRAWHDDAQRRDIDFL